jgi:hypothetical protein
MDPIPVIPQGFGWTAAGAWGSFLVLCGIIVRQIGPWRKQSIDAAQAFRDELLLRIESLEEKLEASRIREGVTQRRHEAERALDRHRLNNVTQCFDAMIMLLEASPERATEIVVRIKEMRADQIKAEAMEKAVIYASAIDAAGEDGK